MTPIRIVVPLCGIFLSGAVRAEEQTAPPEHSAVFQTGVMMLNGCESWGLLAREDCLAYAKGVVDLLSEATATAGGIWPYSICLTHGVTADQVRDIIVQYLEAQSGEARNYSAAGLAAKALATAWPCPITMDLLGLPPLAAG